MITIENEYEVQKKIFNNTLNLDKKLSKNSNDEPTPIDCVEEMISKLPDYLLNKKDIKILDPCCGCGNFFIPLIDILKNSHDLKNILENILTFNDINMDRINVVRKFFDDTKYKLNITTEDFLNYKEDEKYDLIVANPPYAKFSSGKRASKNHNLIGSFLEKSLQLLKDGGFLLFITPDNWMSYSNRNKLIETLTSYQIHYLNIHTAKKYFKKVGSSFTWYIIEKTPFYKNIQIEGIWNKILYKDVVKSEKRKYIPLYYNSIIQNILHKTIDNLELKKFKIETSSDLHIYTKKEFIQEEKTDEFKYKLIHTPSQICWSKKAHKYQDGYKIFISTTTYYKIFVDNCGMTQSILFIRCKNREEAELLSTILKHPLYVFLNNICRFGNFNNICIIKSFPYCDTYDNVYRNFNITVEEQNFISLQNNVA
jgi:adenine-specific DNA-methyltransferase